MSTSKTKSTKKRSTIRQKGLVVKATKEPVAKTNGKKVNPIHERLVQLMTRKNGATITDIAEAGFKYASMAALKIVERRGYKVKVDKKPGELTNYIARKA